MLRSTEWPNGKKTRSTDEKWRVSRRDNSHSVSPATFINAFHCFFYTAKSLREYGRLHIHLRNNELLHLIESITYSKQSSAIDKNNFQLFSDKTWIAKATLIHLQMEYHQMSSSMLWVLRREICALRVPLKSLQMKKCVWWKDSRLMNFSKE